MTEKTRTLESPLKELVDGLYPIPDDVTVEKVTRREWEYFIHEEVWLFDYRPSIATSQPERKIAHLKQWGYGADSDTRLWLVYVEEIKTLFWMPDEEQTDG